MTLKAFNVDVRCMMSLCVSACVGMRVCAMSGVEQQLPVCGSDAVAAGEHPQTGAGAHEGAAHRRRQGGRRHAPGRARHHGAAGRTQVSQSQHLPLEECQFGSTRTYVYHLNSKHLS